jgi:hypothetical protein
MHLAREKLFGAIVIDYGGEGGWVSTECNRRERPALMPETAQQLARQVLRLSGTASVAASKQLASGGEDSRQPLTPLVYDGRGRCRLAGSGGQRIEVPADGLHIALAQSHSAPATSCAGNNPAASSSPVRTSMVSRTRAAAAPAVGQASSTSPRLSSLATRTRRIPPSPARFIAIFRRAVARPIAR